MAYNFTKLSDAELVESTVSTPNILIEEEGDIKRISADDIATPQVQADWNEIDSSSKAFILNKPESFKPNVIRYCLDSGRLIDTEGNVATPDEILENWNSGAVLRIGYGAEASSSILRVTYFMNSGVPAVEVSYLVGNGGIFTETIM